MRSASGLVLAPVGPWRRAFSARDARPDGQTGENDVVFHIFSRFRPLVLAAVLVGAPLAAPSRAQAPPAMPPPESFHLFLLIGQSNMAGRGVVESEDRLPIPRVLMLDRAGAWVPAVDPMHFDKPIAGVGLGRSFAARIADAHPGIIVGLIPAAVGGSAIDSWTRGGFDAATKTHPWDDAMARAKVAMASGTLKGVLWHQGESDSTEALAPAYGRKLEALVARLRETLGAPDLPVIVGQLGAFDGAPWNEARKTVDAAHRQLPVNTARTAFVPSDGLTDKGDRLHFDSRSLRELGRRYADAYLGIASSR